MASHAEGVPIRGERCSAIRHALVLALLFIAAIGAALAAPAPPSPALPDARPVWEFKSELSLTEKQVTDIKAAVQPYETMYAEAAQKLVKLNQKYLDQMTQEAPIEQVKATLEEIAAIQIQVTLGDVKTSRTINHILTKEQLAKWRSIQGASVKPPGK